uniref:Uncharacterized protein n=1 Tax=Arundo donax TaxID=35708 RepID=A0A0A9FLW9_ARUDO
MMPLVDYMARINRGKKVLYKLYYCSSWDQLIHILTLFHHLVL